MAFFTQTHEDRWYAHRIGETQTLSIGIGSVQIRLGVGFYRAVPTVNCYIRQGDQTDFATTSDCFLQANKEIFFQVDSCNDTLVAITGTIAGPGLEGQPAGAEPDDRYISVVRSATNGTLYITRISNLVDSTSE